MKNKFIRSCAVLVLISITAIQAHAEETHVPTIEDIKAMDITKPCGLTLEQLENGLLFDLKPLAQTYLDAERYYGVNAVIKAAQDALESSWGRECFEPNNLSGWYTHREFESKEKCIFFVSYFLSRKYLTPPESCECDDVDCTIGIYFNGYTFSDVSIRYNPIDGIVPNEDYEDAVCQIAYEIYHRALNP